MTRAPRLLLLGGIGLAVCIGILTVPAWAEGGNEVGGLSLLDATDSAGIKISQYELSVDNGGALGWISGQAHTALAVTIAWDFYRWWIGFLAYLVDWTIGMGWVTWITGPLNDAAERLRSAVLEPIGGTGFGQSGLITLLCMIAAAVGGYAVLRGRTGGWATMAGSAAIAAVAVGALAAPVLLFAGDGAAPATPLRYAQRIGVELGNAASTGTLSNTPLDADSPPPEPVAGQLLIDTFIRPAHQELNYGVVLDLLDKGCVGAYDKALKGGPYPKDAKEARDALGGCNKKYVEYAERPSNAWTFTVASFWIAAALVGMVVLTFVILLWFAVITIAWASLMLMFRVLWAIMPGASRGPMIRDLCDIVVGLVYVAVGTALLPLVLVMIRTVLAANPTVPISAQFIALDLVLIAALILLVVNYIQHRRGAKTLAERISGRLRQHAKTPGDDIAGKTWKWLKKPAYGYEQGGGGQFGLAGGYGGGGGGRAGRGIMRRSIVGRVAYSNAGRLVLGGASIAAGAATGGVSVAVKAGQGALTTGRAAALTYRRARTIQRVYRGVHDGRAGRATSGNQRVDETIARASRAHDRLNRHVTNAAMTTVLLGTPTRPDPARTGGAERNLTAPADPTAQTKAPTGAVPEPPPWARRPPKIPSSDRRPGPYRPSRPARPWLNLLIQPKKSLGLPDRRPADRRPAGSVQPTPTPPAGGAAGQPRPTVTSWPEGSVTVPLIRKPRREPSVDEQG